MDKNQIRYDLALAYAKTKLMHEISTNQNTLSSGNTSKEISEMHSLLDWFNSALDEYNNLKDSSFEDFT